MTQINESSLSRVWQHFGDPEKAVGILTAFRGDNTYEQNVARNKSLAADLRNAGYGFFYVDGYWVENQGTDEERKVKEDSIFVVGKASDPGFAANLHRLGNSFNQDAVLVKDSKGTRLIFKDDSEQALGKINPGALSTMYTKLRNNKKSNTFTFTEERDDIGFIARLAGVRK
jgi:hypothetical protein